MNICSSAFAGGQVIGRMNMENPFDGISTDSLQRMFRKKKQPVSKSEIIMITDRMDKVEESLDELKIVIKGMTDSLTDVAKGLAKGASSAKPKRNSTKSSVNSNGN